MGQSGSGSTLLSLFYTSTFFARNAPCAGVGAAACCVSCCALVTMSCSTTRLEVTVVVVLICWATDAVGWWSAECDVCSTRTDDGA